MDPELKTPREMDGAQLKVFNVEEWQLCQNSSPFRHTDKTSNPSLVVPSVPSTRVLHICITNVTGQLFVWIEQYYVDGYEWSE